MVRSGFQVQLRSNVYQDVTIASEQNKDVCINGHLTFGNIIVVTLVVYTACSWQLDRLGREKQLEAQDNWIDWGEENSWKHRTIGSIGARKTVGNTGQLDRLGRGKQLETQDNWIDWGEENSWKHRTIGSIGARKTVGNTGQFGHVEMSADNLYRLHRREGTGRGRETRDIHTYSNTDTDRHIQTHTDIEIQKQKQKQTQTQTQVVDEAR